MVPFVRGLQLIALASLRGGDVASAFAAWLNRSFPGAFAIAMLYQAVLRTRVRVPPMPGGGSIRQVRELQPLARRHSIDDSGPMTLALQSWGTNRLGSPKLARVYGRSLAPCLGVDLSKQQQSSDWGAGRFFHLGVRPNEQPLTSLDLADLEGHTASELLQKTTRPRRGIRR